MQEEENPTGVSRIKGASVSVCQCGKCMYADKGKSQAATSAKNGVSCVWSRGAPKSWSCRVKSKLVPSPPPPPPWGRCGPLQELQSCICATNGHNLHSVADKQAGTGAGSVRVCYSWVCSWHYRLSRVIAHTATCPLSHTHCPGLPPAGSQWEGRTYPLQLWSQGKQAHNRSCLLAFLRPRTPTRGQ